MKWYLERGNWKVTQNTGTANKYKKSQQVKVRRRKENPPERRGWKQRWDRREKEQQQYESKAVEERSQPPGRAPLFRGHSDSWASLKHIPFLKMVWMNPAPCNQNPVTSTPYTMQCSQEVLQEQAGSPSPSAKRAYPYLTFASQHDRLSDSCRWHRLYVSQRLGKC